jgi:hypothetical protein
MFDIKASRDEKKRVVAAWEGDGYRVSVKCSTDGRTDMTKYVFINRLNQEHDRAHKLRFGIGEGQQGIGSFSFTEDEEFRHAKPDIDAAESFLNDHIPVVEALQRRAVGEGRAIYRQNLQKRNQAARRSPDTSGLKQYGRW